MRSSYLLMARYWSEGHRLPLVVVTGHFVDGSRHFWNIDKEAVSISLDAHKHTYTALHDQ